MCVENRQYPELSEHEIQRLSSLQQALDTAFVYRSPSLDDFKGEFVTRRNPRCLKQLMWQGKSL
jgi:hypothetical protein